MKILLIARDCPFPANDGGKIRIFNLIKNLSHHDITLVCRTMSPEDQAGIAELKKYCRTVYGIYIPSPGSFIKKLNWVLPFVFSKYPLGMSTIFFKEIQKTIQEICANERFDVIQVEHSSLTIYLDDLFIPDTSRTILTMHNIDYIRNERVIENLSFGIKKIYELINQAKYKQWELACLERYDRIIAMSELDREIMINDVPGLNVDIIPNGVDTFEITYKEEERSQENNKNIVYVSSLDNEANHDGAMYFVDEIFPIIKNKCPDAVIRFVGRCPRKELVDRHNGSDIVVTGMVPSVIKYYQEAAVAIVPLRSGGGTRLKVLEAMAAGVPVVSTTVGAEGINITSGTDIWLADTPDCFAHCVVDLFNDMSMRSSIVKHAREKVEKEYDWKIISQRHDLLYKSLQLDNE